MDEQLRLYLQKAAGQVACARDRFYELQNPTLAAEMAEIVRRLEKLAVTL